MERKIEHPKVFISYSWSGKVYEQKVLDFACRLKTDGIEVILDKWNMKPGNDTIDFMEKCVKDPDVNFVLMLLDKAYTEKADKRQGGVGIETQIISEKVYKSAAQEKFVPIVFDRDEDGKIYKPIYLTSRLHFDMTSDNREDEYIKLVKHLFGREIYYEPELGNMPNWVDNSNSKNIKQQFDISMNKNEEETLEKLYNEIYKFECEVNFVSVLNKENIDKVLISYNNFIQFRDILIMIFNNSANNTNFVDNILDFYEKIKDLELNGLKDEIVKDFIHETFIYLIAILYKKRKYKEINILLTKTYFVNVGNFGGTVKFKEYFYSGSNRVIEQAKCLKDNKQYYSGLAELWLENLNINTISRDEFLFADLLIYNLSIILLEKQSWYWFPKTYCYNSRLNRRPLLSFSIKLKSKYEYERKKALFSNLDVNEFKKQFDNMKEIKETGEKRARYPAAFDWADLILDHVNIDELCSMQ